MDAIFEASGASEYTMVSGPRLLEELGLPDQDAADACRYLEGEHLINNSHTSWGHLTPFHIQITHWGIREMEQSRQAPEEPTPHFPPLVSVVHVEGDMIGSTVQSGSPGAHQEVTVGDIDVAPIRDFIRGLEEQEPVLGLPEDESKELAAEIATLNAQIDSPKPKKNIIRESLRSIRSILEGIGGNLAAAQLLTLMQHIHL
jgi:hypothetical protein